MAACGGSTPRVAACTCSADRRVPQRPAPGLVRPREPDPDIEALTFATAREAFDDSEGEHEGLGGDGVAILYGMQNLAIRRSDARWLTERGERLVYLRKVALMKGDGDVVVGLMGGEPPERGATTA